jgi:colicin import membrane protein
MDRGKLKAWIGAIVVHVLLVIGLIFSVRWKHEETPVVSVDIVTQTIPSAPARAEAQTPLPPAPTPPVSPVASAPPPAAIKVPPTPSPIDIARKKAEMEKLRIDDERAEAAKKAAREIVAKKESEKKQLDARIKEVAAAQDRALKEQRTQQERLAREKEIFDKANREAAEKAAAQERADAIAREANAKARARAEGDYVAKIRSKIRGNIILATDPPGNPEAVFEVNQLPTGEVLDVRLVKSSGNVAYDQAVERAILKSSPLPKPDQADLFQRRLTLRFRPGE